MGSVNVILRKNRPNKEGKIAVVLRVTVERISAEEYLCYIYEKHWKAGDERVLHHDPSAPTYNKLITSRKKELLTLIDHYTGIGQIISGRQLLNINFPQWEAGQQQAVPQSPNSFMAHAGELIDAKRRNRKFTSAQRYQSHYATLEDYLTLLDKEDLLLEEVTDRFLEDFFAYLRTKPHKPNGPNTLHRRFGWFKTVIIDAHRAGRIDRLPYRAFKTKPVKVKKPKLRTDEVASIESLPDNAPVRERRATDIFLLQLYAYGSRISDILTLQNKNVFPKPDGRYILEFHQRKTGTFMSIELPAKGVKLLKQYYRTEVAHLQPDQFVIPWLKWEDDPTLSPEENEMKLEKEIQSKTTMVNTNLKRAAKKAEVESHLTSHVARHTWAMAAKRKKVDIYAISQALGHSSISQTATYLNDLDDEQIHQAMRNVLD